MSTILPRFVMPYQTALSLIGAIIPGAKLYFYESGTTTPQDTYSQDNGTVPNSNPVTADASGTFPNIFLGPNAYKVILTDASDVQIWTADPVEGGAGGNVPNLGNLILLSSYDGDLVAANAAAAAIGSQTPILIDTDADTISANTVLTNPITAWGGLIPISGTATLTVPYVSGNLQVFDLTSSSATGPVILSNQKEVIDGIWFGPPNDGLTDCITQWNALANCVTGNGASFRWPPGKYHTAYANKFNLPGLDNLQMDFQGAVFDSSITYRGSYSTIHDGNVGAQCIITLTSVSGAFTTGESINVVGSRANATGAVVSWNSGTSKLQVNCFLNSIIAGGGQIVGSTSGAVGTVSSVATMIAAGTENSVSTTFSTTDVKRIQLTNMRVYNSQNGHVRGATGTNTDGSTTPTLTTQNHISCQNCIDTNLQATSIGSIGIKWDGTGTSSFLNDNLVIAPVSSACNDKGMYLSAGCNYNVFQIVDFENNNIVSGTANVLVEGLDNVFLGGLITPAGVATNTISYSSTNTRLYMFGVRLTGAPTGNQITALNTQSGFTGWNTLLSLSNITTAEAGISGTIYAPTTGLSTFPASLVTFTLGSSGTTGHKFAFDLSTILAAQNHGHFTTKVYGIASGTASHLVSFTIGWAVQRDSIGADVLVYETASASSGATFVAIALSGTTANLTWNTASSIASAVQVTSFNDNLNTDFRT